MSQTMIRLSTPVVYSVRPSSETLTWVTRPLWPVSVSRTLPRRRSHDQPAAVVADGRQRAPVGAERELLHSTVVPVRQPPALPRAEVQERDAAVLAAEGGTAAIEGQPGGERPAREPLPHTERRRVHHVRRVLGGPGEDEAVTPCPDDGRGRVRPAHTQDAPQLPPAAHVEATDVGGVRRS